MWSKVLEADDPRPVERLVWPKAPALEEPAESAQGAQAPQPALEPPPEPQIDLAQVERQWQQRVAEARAAGLREGEAAGRNRAMAEIQPVLERLARSIDDLAGLRPRLRREAEADMVKLSIAIARRIVRRDLAVDPEALHGLVLGALEKLQLEEINRVRAHPAQAPAIQELLRARAAGLAIEVVPDASAQPGAAVFETARGDLDASVETQLAEIERGLADTLRRQQR